MADTTSNREFKRSDSAVAADTTLAASIEDDIRSEDIFADDGYGDLIVHVGTTPVRRIFLVDSGVLCAASVKWRAILRHRRSDTPWHLSEDDPEAFSIAMKAAYYRTSEIPNDLSDEVLLSVGALCSKYSLHRVLSHKIVIWEGELAQRALEVRLTAAWDFLLKAEFESAWKDVVKHVVEEEDGGLILRKVQRIQVMSSPAPGKSAKTVRRGGRNNKSVRYDSNGSAFTDEPKTVFQQPTGLEEEVIVSRGMLNEEILERALNQRYECFSTLSESYETILNAISLGFASTDDPAIDAKRGLVNDSSHACAQHQQTLFDRLLEIARLKDLLSIGFPLGFKNTLQFDTQNDTLEEFANSIRKEIILAGRDIACDDVEQILKSKIDSVLDGIGLLGSELAHFEPKVEEKVNIKRKREGTTATAQTPAPPVAPPGTSQVASAPSDEPTIDDDPETKRQKLDTAEVLATEASVSTSNANLEISGQQGSSSDMTATTFDPAKDAIEKVAKDRYQALSFGTSTGLKPVQRADNEICITDAQHIAPEEICGRLLGENASEIAMSGSIQALDTSVAIEPLAKDDIRPATDGELLAVLGAPSSSESDNHDSEYSLDSDAGSDRAQTPERSNSRESQEERIEVAPFVAPEVKSEVIKEEGQA